ncbi:hypothetical Protein YC6258_04525 [Gynuella sunshinyii YC6258]|uniref:Uncharacterized protein n=1 Tax=Gynuella sunshinyii YC6258 TaxID=1445510 RepID=A0A0C5VPH8_9GAMM|nr:hypothetical Protein YC6258_04525 [Gynuella sunshinyii YC6258]
MLLSSQQGCFHGVFDFRCIHLNQLVSNSKTLKKTEIQHPVSQNG